MAKYTKPNLEYYYCNACSFAFRRRTPLDPFNDPVLCPNCNETEKQLEREGEKCVNVHGNPIPTIAHCEGHVQIAKWKRLYAVQERQLPYVAAPEQWFKVKSRLVDLVMMHLSALDWKILCYLLRMSDTEKGWTMPISQQTIGTVIMGPGRKTPVKRDVVRESLNKMCELWIEQWDPITKDFRSVKLIERSLGNPSRFKVNQP